MFAKLAVTVAFFLPAVLGAPASHDIPQLLKRAGHQLTITNRCGGAIQPVIADTRCGYSPRCADAVAYSGAQPRTLNGGGDSQTLTVDERWVGRIFAQNGACGAKGESCSLSEWNLDTGDQFTAQAYDLSNIQGFTQSLQISMAGCNAATCTNANCGCTNAYPIGDTSGCGNDSPVKGCGPGDVAMNVVFCP